VGGYIYVWGWVSMDGWMGGCVAMCVCAMCEYGMAELCTATYTHIDLNVIAD